MLIEFVTAETRLGHGFLQLVGDKVTKACAGVAVGVRGDIGLDYESETVV